MIRDFDNIEQVAAMLRANGINVSLLCDFVQEAMESQSLLHSLSERVSLSDSQSTFPKPFMDDLHRFCILLTKAKSQFPDSNEQHVFGTISPNSFQLVKGGK